VALCGRSRKKRMMTTERPYTLIAELTYSCPLRCVYCSNPVDYARRATALDTESWLRVFQEAEDLGVVHVNLTGGEPLLRDDLERFIAEARALDLYTNLITSGVPLERRRLARFRDYGLDSVQLSFQAVSVPQSDWIAGVAAFEHKLAVAGWVKELGLPLTMNIVLHRENLDSLTQVIELAERIGADRLELANTQYLGWALLNRGVLLPSREQIERARSVAYDARDRLSGRMEILFVTPDYYSDFPKTCMDGWGRRYIVISPDGLALPCHAAHTLPGIRFETVKEHPLREIWQNSDAFNCFRGESWMPEPCRTCERRSADHGGCRCQAFHLTGNPAATDPACKLAPHHTIIQRAREEAEMMEAPIALRYRRPMNAP
jgi:pyrroloquinoline quinone biosynthesis protein E